MSIFVIIYLCVKKKKCSNNKKEIYNDISRSTVPWCLWLSSKKYISVYYITLEFCWGHKVECWMEHIHKNRPLVTLADIQCFIHKSKYTIHLVQTKVCNTRITFFFVSTCMCNIVPWISWIALYLWQSSGTIVYS